MPPNEEGRPGQGATSTDEQAGGRVVENSVRREELGRRALAALRLPPLDCGHRDPLVCAAAPDGPGTYGLDRDELAAEIRRCAAAGWQRWELAQVFADPSTAVAA